MMANKRTLNLATACLFAAGSLVHAQDPSAGIVRISDSKAMMAKPASMSSSSEYHAHTGGDMYYGDAGCPHCQGGKQKGGKFCERYCTHSADHGYSIPGKWPIQRRGVQYQQLFPQQYYSVNGGHPYAVAAPQVYTPTDTTQLGYYSQHVPFWTPQPNPLPARPIPAQWHHYAPTVYASQFGEMYSKGGTVYEGEVIYESAAPTNTNGTPTQLQPVPEPQPQNQLPPEPLKESSVPQPLQRVGY